MKVHVFPFSRRDGTPAAEMQNQVSPQVIRERVRILSELERDLALQFYQHHVGASAELLEVLVERPSEHRPGFVRGTDRKYIPVEVPGTEADFGRFINCKGETADRSGILASRTDSITAEKTPADAAIETSTAVQQAHAAATGATA